MKTLCDEEFTLISLKYKVEYFNYPTTQNETIAGPFMIESWRAEGIRVFDPFQPYNKIFVKFTEGYLSIFMYKDNFYIRSDDKIYCVYFDINNRMHNNTIRYLESKSDEAPE